MDKTQRLKEFIGICLQENVNDPRRLPIKETTINLGLSVLMVLVTALHLVLSCLQFGISLIVVGYDLIAKNLPKIMPTPKPPRNGELVGK